MCSQQIPEPEGISPMRILLVEDSALIRDAIVDSLSGNPAIRFDGFATTQSEAIALLHERTFELMLVDIELAEGNGFEVIKALKKGDLSASLPICLMFTNHAYTYYRNQATRFGVSSFFHK